MAIPGRLREPSGSALRICGHDFVGQQYLCAEILGVSVPVLRRDGQPFQRRRAVPGRAFAEIELAPEKIGGVGITLFG